MSMTLLWTACIYKSCVAFLGKEANLRGAESSRRNSPRTTSTGGRTREKERATAAATPRVNPPRGRKHVWRSMRSRWRRGTRPRCARSEKRIRRRLPRGRRRKGTDLRYKERERACYEFDARSVSDFSRKYLNILFMYTSQRLRSGVLFWLWEKYAHTVN
jgi:hypothetical protein